LVLDARGQKLARYGLGTTADDDSLLTKEALDCASGFKVRYDWVQLGTGVGRHLSVVAVRPEPLDVQTPDLLDSCADVLAEGWDVWQLDGRSRRCRSIDVVVAGHVSALVGRVCLTVNMRLSETAANRGDVKY
jgi:hypothetical protein